MYLDTSYIAKFYLDEPESERVRALVQKAGVIRSSSWALPEFHAVLHRQVREAGYSPAMVRQISSQFSEHIEAGLWDLMPVGEALLRRSGALILSAPSNLLIRGGDAIHLTAALDAGELEVWTNDRRMLAAAPHFGLTGRSV